MLKSNGNNKTLKAFEDLITTERQPSSVYFTRIKPGLPSDTCRDFSEGETERFISAGLRSVLQWGAFLGAGDRLGVMLTEDRLRASSDSPSVRPMSSLELDSGLLTHTAFLGPFES